MSDITALALIAKIKKQTESFDTVVLQEGEAKALVEALEKAQRHANLTEAERPAYLGLISKRDELIAELDKRLIEYAGIATREARRVAELEARAVSIPEVRITVAESKRKNLTWRELGAYNEGADVAKERISKVLAAAGIKVKGE
ncbi:hypothetical protein AH421_12025 [Salmonella enterica]|nr:hypothetical protein [Salmonella enterica]